MITAEAQQGNLVEAIQAGVSNYIVKPFTAETMQEKLEQIFQ
jgi:two-component system chemotaxis response regulator CheY